MPHATEIIKDKLGAELTDKGRLYVFCPVHRAEKCKQDIALCDTWWQLPPPRRPIQARDRKLCSNMHIAYDIVYDIVYNIVTYSKLDEWECLS